MTMCSAIWRKLNTWHSKVCTVRIYQQGASDTQWGSISLVNSDPGFTSCLTPVNVCWPRAAAGRAGDNQDRFPRP